LSTAARTVATERTPAQPIGARRAPARGERRHRRLGVVGARREPEGEERRPRGEREEEREPRRLEAPSREAAGREEDADEDEALHEERGERLEAERFDVGGPREALEREGVEGEPREGERAPLRVVGLVSGDRERVARRLEAAPRLDHDVRREDEERERGPGEARSARLREGGPADERERADAGERVVDERPERRAAEEGPRPRARASRAEERRRGERRDDRDEVRVPGGAAAADLAGESGEEERPRERGARPDLSSRDEERADDRPGGEERDPDADRLGVVGDEERRQGVEVVDAAARAIGGREATGGEVPFADDLAGVPVLDRLVALPLGELAVREPEREREHEQREGRDERPHADRILDALFTRSHIFP
jgi:hypothetical protein